MSAIDEATNTVTATIAVGGLPSGVAVDPTTGTVYVTNSGDNTVSAINEATDTVTATIAVGGIRPVAEDPTTGTSAYGLRRRHGVGDRRTTGTVTATVGAGGFPDAVAVDPDTHTAYVTDETGNTVSVISADGDARPPAPRFLAPSIRSANHAAFRPGKHASFAVPGRRPPRPVGDRGRQAPRRPPLHRRRQRHGGNRGHARRLSQGQGQGLRHHAHRERRRTAMPPPSGSP